jgi:hypothetical protein
MKVGIFTFHYAYNYGAVLQCLALYRTLKNLGVDVDVIRYVPEEFRDSLSFWRGWGVTQGHVFRNIPKKWIAIRHGSGMQQSFDEFRATHFTFSLACTAPSEIAAAVSGYDALITGSDQVWHFSQKAAFFLEWDAPYDGKRISYAPCCGHTEQPQGRGGQIKEWLARFDQISVRNDFSQKIIEQVVGNPVPVVADPTLLTDISDVQQKIDLPCSDYILMYTLGEEIPGGHKRAIELIRDKIGDIPVVAVIPSAHKPHLAPWADIKIWEAGPAEWLYLIANAKFVYTDSFHGAIFALKHKRPFVVYYAEEGRAPRMTDLARRYRLEGVVAQDVDSLERCLSASSFGDYKESFRLIDRHVAESMEYLRKALGV